jgi:hypothetical protein
MNDQLEFNLEENKKPICPVCGNSFEKRIKISRQKYCSKKCSNKYNVDTNRINRRKSYNGSKKFYKFECKNCGKDFIKKSSKSIYCSQFCKEKVKLKNDKEKRKIRRESRTFVKCICPTCGNSFDKTTYSRKYCSTYCGRKKYEEENKDKIKARKKLKHIKDRNDVVKVMKNRERIKKYTIENRKKISEYENNRFKNDPIFRFKKLTRSRISDEIKKAGGNKIYKMVDLLGCTALEAKEHLEKQFKEGMSWENHGNNGWHIDHIIPCASFDLTDQEQQKKCFYYTNLQPLWASENLSKGAKIL